MRITASASVRPHKAAGREEVPEEREQEMQGRWTRLLMTEGPVPRQNPSTPSVRRTSRAMAATPADAGGAAAGAWRYPTVAAPLVLAAAEVDAATLRAACSLVCGVGVGGIEPGRPNSGAPHTWSRHRETKTREQA